MTQSSDDLGAKVQPVVAEFVDVGLRFSLRKGAWWRKSGHEEFWPLREVNFQINRGDVVGVIGRNGAGKTTCTRLLAGIYKPTEGQVRVATKVSLISLGVGFNPQLSCRQNVRINAAHLGYGLAEVRERENDIIEFAELGRFADQPVKVLSSGMRSRLVFSIATHLDPELLILDEVLATGDRFFREKAREKLGGVMQKAKASVIVSHQETILRQLCNKVIWLEAGGLRAVGPAAEVLDAYGHSGREK